MMWACTVWASRSGGAGAQTDSQLRLLESLAALALIVNLGSNPCVSLSARAAECREPPFRAPLSHSLTTICCTHTDIRRDVHDWFNLVILVPIVGLNVVNWDWKLIASRTCE